MPGAIFDAGNGGPAGVAAMDGGHKKNPGKPGGEKTQQRAMAFKPDYHS
ncbi:hypothetical protein CJA_3308 [Cellvibrio japonicus Ueda107]|uniref:Uncharacterized protein n=1 Tax=Cellvibrio japonicus (strain Ueda107) TaxID=498211 RepID=B3PEK6_CELJU|nr:hypothetical protein CJA_3308 [Cellvibrio japonicus Ueda107]